MGAVLKPFTHLGQLFLSLLQFECSPSISDRRNSDTAMPTEGGRRGRKRVEREGERRRRRGEGREEERGRIEE